MSCTDHDPDHVRAKTVFLDNAAGDPDDPRLSEKIDFCPGARLYSYTFSAHWMIEDEDPPNEVAGILSWQDSRLELKSYGCSVASIHADLPGLAWPAFAKLEATAGWELTLHVTYGHCA